MSSRSKHDDGCTVSEIVRIRVGCVELLWGGQARERFAYPKERDHEQRRNNHETQDQVVEPIEPGDPPPSRPKIERCVGEPRHAIPDHDGIGHDDSRRQ